MASKSLLVAILHLFTGISSGKTLYSLGRTWPRELMRTIFVLKKPLLSSIWESERVQNIQLAQITGGDYRPISNLFLHAILKQINWYIICSPLSMQNKMFIVVINASTHKSYNEMPLKANFNTTIRISDDDKSVWHRIQQCNIIILLESIATSFFTKNKSSVLARNSGRHVAFNTWTYCHTSIHWQCIMELTLIAA